MFLENVFPPIPSEIIMPLAGFTVTQENLKFACVVVAGIVGSLMSALLWYYVGKRLGEDCLESWTDR